ncbi:MAG: InlB B-repeat-containing protein [Clostridia bacterium]|nr:InlB B-repeat-containing protein [Clostridia bacterium]
MKNKFKLLVTLLTVLFVSSAFIACTPLSQIPVPDEDKISVQFVDHDGTVISSELYIEETEIVVPANPTRADSDGYAYTFAGWDKEVCPIANENVVYTATYTATPIVYTLTFFADGNQVGDAISYTVEDTELNFPEVPAKAHYEGSWEEFSLSTGNVQVNAVYVPVTYTISFMDGSDLVEAVAYNVENANEKTAPALPTKNGYTASWGAYDFSLLSNQTVQVSYEVINYTVKFLADGNQVGELLSYNVENTSVVAPAVPDKAHYTGAWEAYELTYGNVEVEAVYTPVNYTISFMNGENLVEAVSFNIEDNEKTAPTAPQRTGYTGSWGAYSFDTLEDQTVQVEFTPNVYVITYNANGGTVASATQEVTYATDYTLANPTPAKMYHEFLGWFDANGEQVTDGVWELDGNLALTAKYSDGLSFEGTAGIPAYITAGNGSIALAEVSTTDGNKALALTASNAAPALYVTVEFLADFFADSSVDYIAFDAMATKYSSNFRRMTEKSGALGDITYEIDKPAYLSGVNTTWKTFYFSRADYNAWVKYGATNNKIIHTGGFASGDIIYIDNIRPATNNNLYGFEGGALRDAGSAVIYYYTPDYASNWSVAITGNTLTAAEMTYTNVSQGFRALQITKNAGDAKIYIPKARKMLEEIIATDYMAIDVYVPVGSDATYYTAHLRTYVNDNATAVAKPIPLKAGEWNTVYIYSPLSGLYETPLAIQDTTGGTYVIDNIRSVTKAEYDAALLGFERADGRINRDGQDSFDYYAGPDQKSNRRTIRAKAGSGTISEAWFDSSITHSGNYSLAFTKTDKAYLQLYIRSDSAYSSYLRTNGFTFWIYSTVSINGSSAVQNIKTGNNGALHKGEGLILTKNTWTQITIYPEDLTSDGRFFIINGSASTDGTFYIDDFQPLPAE